MIRTQTLVPFEEEEPARAFPTANGTIAPTFFRDGSKARRPERLPLTPAPSEIAPYPIGAMGPILGRAAAAIASKVRVPDALAAQSVLGAAALVAQNYRDVLMPFGQTRPLSCYFVTVAGSGDRKSTADAEALWPVRKREKALRDEHEGNFADWAIRYAAHAAQKRKIEVDKGLNLIDRTNELRALGPEPRRPLEPLLTAPDPTIEGLAKAWVNAPAGLGLFSAEGGAFFGGHGMSQDHKLKTAAGLSELWDGNGIRRMRAGDGLTILCGRRLSAHLMAQPEAAAVFLTDPVLRDQGFLSRFLIASPESIAGERLYREPDAQDEAAIRAYGARLLELLEHPARMTEGKLNELNPEPLGFSPEAKAEWRAFFDHVEMRCGANGELESIKPFASKAAEHAARFAGVLTVIADCNALEISQAVMTDAIALTDWYLQEALRLAETAKISPALIKAQKLLDWMRAESTSEVGFRHILQFGPPFSRTKADAEPVLSILIEHGHIEALDGSPRRYRIRAEQEG